VWVYISGKRPKFLNRNAYTDLFKKRVNTTSKVKKPLAGLFLCANQIGGLLPPCEFHSPVMSWWLFVFISSQSQTRSLIFGDLIMPEDKALEFCRTSSIRQRTPEMTRSRRIPE
jgi:hypothetical protein